MAETRKLPFVLSMAVLVIAGVCPVASDSETTTHFYGAVHVVNEDSVTSQLYHYTGVVGERTTTPLPPGFPPACTTCDPGAPTEYCEYKDGYCIKLSNSKISILATNGSVLYRHSTCPARYLHRLDKWKYAIVCRDSSYQLLHLRENSGPELAGNSAGIEVGGILVQAVSSLYHVELAPTHIVTYDVDQSNVGHISPDRGYDSCMLETLALHPTFSSTGRFFLYCSTGDDSKAYFSCLVEIQICDELDLCSDPLPSPPGPAGSDTFTTACNNTLTVYHTDDPAENHSASFGSRIASHTYLDRNTLQIDTASEQHIVTVDIFLKSNGSGGIQTLENTTNCSVIHRLIFPDVYATVCQSGLFYDVRLVNKTSGESLGPIANLTRQPHDIYFDIQEPPDPPPILTPPASYPTPETTTKGGDYTIEAPAPTPTVTPTAAATIPTTTASKTPTNLPTSTTSFPVSVAIIVPLVSAIIVLTVCTVLLFVFKCRASKSKCQALAMQCRKRYPTQEECEEGQSNPMSSLSQSESSGYSSAANSITTHPIPETNPSQT